jgi:hypothetical protein
MSWFKIRIKDVEIRESLFIYSFVMKVRVH